VQAVLRTACKPALIVDPSFNMAWGSWAAAEVAQRSGRLRENGRRMPDWLPPFLIAAITITLLNLALLEQGRRTRRRNWGERLLRELRAWDGRIPEEFDRPQRRST
jgi:hypothetical protein